MSIVGSVETNALGNLARPLIIGKKKSFSFLMGPPPAAPNWFRMKTGFWLFSHGSKNPVALSDVLRGTPRPSRGTGWSRCAPRRSITAPPARPYSALKLLVSSRNSCTASGVNCTTWSANPWFDVP